MLGTSINRPAFSLFSVQHTGLPLAACLHNMKLVHSTEHDKLCRCCCCCYYCCKQKVHHHMKQLKYENERYLGERLVVIVHLPCQRKHSEGTDGHSASSDCTIKMSRVLTDAVVLWCFHRPVSLSQLCFREVVVNGMTDSGESLRRGYEILINSVQYGGGGRRDAPRDGR